MYHFYLKSENNHSTYNTDIMAVPYEDEGKFWSLTFLF